VEELHVRQLLVANVVGRERLVGPRVVQEAPIDSRRTDHDRVAGRRRLGHDHVARQLGSQRIEHRPPEEIGADLPGEPHVNAEPMQRKPRVRDRAASRERHRADDDEPTGLEPRRAVQLGKQIERDVARDYDTTSDAACLS